MRKNKILDALWPKVRQQILAATVLHPDRWWSLSELARFLEVSPSSLQRELAAFVEAGILMRQAEGRRVCFRPHPDCPVLPELQGLLAKTAGLADILRDALTPWAQVITLAFVFGSIARAEELSESDVDLFIIGAVGLAELAAPLRDAERQLGRPVNPTVYSKDEFTKKWAAGNHFLRNVVAKEKLFLLGTRHDLERLAQAKPNPAPHDQQGRTRQPARRHRARPPGRGLD